MAIGVGSIRHCAVPAAVSSPRKGNVNLITAPELRRTTCGGDGFEHKVS
jgi:hypothetical protein